MRKLMVVLIILAISCLSVGSASAASYGPIWPKSTSF